MEFEGTREEIPIWWRSDSSSRYDNKTNHNGDDKGKIFKSNLRKSSARTIKKWFLENQVGDGVLIEPDQKNNLKCDYFIKKLDFNKLNSSRQFHSDNSVEFVSNTINSKNICKPCFSSSSVNKSAYEEPSSVGQSNRPVHGYPSKSIPIPLFTISLPSSYSSQSLPSRSFSSSSSSSPSFSYSSSCSCSSCCSCLNSSTSFVDSLSSSSSISLERNEGKEEGSTKKSSQKSKGLSKPRIVGTTHSELKNAINSVKKGVISIQKLPTIMDIPLNPYFCVDNTNNDKIIQPETRTATDDKAEVHKEEKIEQEHKPEEKEEILERISKLDGWDKLKQVMYSDITNKQDNVVFSFNIYHIDLTVSKYESNNLEILKMSPRITVSIRSGFLSNQLIQNHSKIAFLLNEKRYYWGEYKDRNLSKKSGQGIQFMIPTFQIKDSWNFFSVIIEGVNLFDNLVKEDELDSVFLGITFCPLPQKNDHWDITLPIYFTRRRENENFDTKGDTIIKHDYLPKDYEKVGFLSFKVSRRKLDDIESVNKPTEKTDNKENHAKSETESSIGSIKEEIDVEKTLSRTIVSGEVHHSICSFSGKNSDPMNTRERELQLREREISLKEKELELKIKAFAMESLGQTSRIEDKNKPREEKDNPCVLDRNTQKHRISHNHLFCERRFNRYFRVNKKTRILKENVRILPLNNRRNEREMGLLNRNINLQDTPSKKEKMDSKSINGRVKKRKSKNKTGIDESTSISGQILFPQIGSVTPIQLPIIINKGVPVTSQTIEKEQNNEYFMYYNPTTVCINDQENVRTRENTYNVEQRIGNLAKVNVSQVKNKTMKHLVIPIRSKCNFDTKISSCSYNKRNTIAFNNLSTLGKTDDSSEECKKVNSFLKSSFNIISIDSDIIWYESGKCSNLSCKSIDTKISYSNCEYANMEIDYWSICEDCQIKMFPTLYNLSEDSPKFIEFFFDSPVPLYFPSKKSIWPTSLHFLLSQFTSDCEKVRNCKTYDDLVKLTRSMKSSLNNDIFPYIIKIIMVMKVFQHPAMQKMLLSFSEREFFMIKNYWIKNDYVLNIFNSKLLGVDIGVLLSETLENLKAYIQFRQR
ncbi:hypothetical protein FG386_002006 [Cryptosporidium ryanae]|uniref:uncharacterized protein n=1 Tax=Cryptosporidium ryanae TaxID=515981 RepID=UPI00351A85E0|nr:hypothetical protein FG386_002006 [Cryptosporidium ryanae]